MSTTPRGGAGAIFLVVIGAFALLFFGGMALKSGIGEGGGASSPLFRFGAAQGDLPGVNRAQQRTHSRDTDGTPSLDGVPAEATSPYAGKITVRRGNAETEDNVQDEYIELVASSGIENPITITGWRVANAPRVVERKIGDKNSIPSRTVPIPGGASIARNTGGNTTAPIALEAGDVAYLVTGEAPDVYPAFLNVSFRTNVCIGYLADAFDFSPSFNSAGCPDPEDAPGAADHGGQCLNFIERISDCEVPLDQTLIDAKLSNSCRTFIRDSYDYQGCVDMYQRDPDFLGDRWYVYLDYFTEDLWENSGDTIILLDENGLVVDWLSYD